MDKLTSSELRALIRFHANDALGIDVNRVAEIVVALQVAERREMTTPKAVA